jgi:hypothetical protein
VKALPECADKNQKFADFWAILTGILAAVTSLSIFPVLTDNATDFEKGVIAVFAFLAAVCALVPRVMNFGEHAGQARELTTRYGHVLGDLLDISKAQTIPQNAARRVVNEFESIKEKKDALRGLPDRYKGQRERKRYLFRRGPTRRDQIEPRR